MYQHIVASIDESNNASQALEQAIAVAKLAGAQLHLVHIVNLFELALEEVVLADKAKLAELAHRHGEARLVGAAAQARAAGLEPSLFIAECWGGGDEIADGLLNYARSVPADLLVLGTHGRSGLMHMMLGSVAESVMRQADMPLLVVRSETSEHTPGKRRPVL